MADTELANNLKKLTKANKKDYAHTGHLTYIHWTNCINESRCIIRKCGLTLDLTRKGDLESMFLPIAAIDDHFKAKDTTTTRKRCNEVRSYFFVRERIAFLVPNCVKQ